MVSGANQRDARSAAFRRRAIIALTFVPQAADPPFFTGLRLGPVLSQCLGRLRDRRPSPRPILGNFGLIALLGQSPVRSSIETVPDLRPFQPGVRFFRRSDSGDGQNLRAPSGLKRTERHSRCGKRRRNFVDRFFDPASIAGEWFPVGTILQRSRTAFRGESPLIASGGRP